MTILELPPGYKKPKITTITEEELREWRTRLEEKYGSREKLEHKKNTFGLSGEEWRALSEFSRLEFLEQ